MSKPTLLVPIAGRGQRFFEKGFTNPKPLILAGGKHIIDYSFDSIVSDEYDIVFIVRSDHVRSFAIDEVLRAKYGNSIKIVETQDITGGSVCSCLLAREHINKDSPLIVYTLDVGFLPAFKVSDVPKESDGHILTFRANSDAYSYVESSGGFAIATAEKRVISQQAAVGIYYFKSAEMFFSAADQMIKSNQTTNGEYYVCPLYNILIKDGRKITSSEVEKMNLMGTPEELDFFVKKTLPQLGQKPVALCCDHSGFELKEAAKEAFDYFSIKFIDFGSYCSKDCDYNDYVRQATKHIKDGICDFGFGFCRSGQGVNIAANKVSGIRSALVFDEYTAEFSRKHNCANFFSVPSKYVDYELFHKLLSSIVYNSFDGGRHMSRVIKAESNASL
jgi:RpiB/LacA/LacB family sugar-phosphate isomerase